MKFLSIISSLLTIFLALPALGEGFDGTWSIDLRTEDEKKSNAECGHASFALSQLANNVIIGSHEFYTVGCGRINEGSPIEGKVEGKTAILVITSGRNNAVVKGKATLKNDKLHWHVLKELSAGDPPDDGLILADAVLELEKESPIATVRRDTLKTPLYISR